MNALSKEGKACLLKVGEVAKRVGVTLRTVRYYQSLGLIQASHRTAGGVHLYGEEVCDRIRFIRDLRSLAVPLSTIRGIIDERCRASTGAEAAQSIVATLNQEMVEIDARVQRYLGLQREMEEALGILESCLDCREAPSRAACMACGNLSGRDSVPAYVRGTLGP